jgi:hypothetical protein
MSSTAIDQVIPILTEPLVRTSLYPSPEQALKSIILDYVDRQMTQIEAELKRYEQKYQLTFAEWSESLSGRASIADEDDWLDWEANLDMLDSWRQIKSDIEQSDV